MGKPEKIKGNGKALIPFLVFVAVYLAAGIILQIKGVEMAFYEFPAPVAVIVGIIVAFFLLEGSIDEKFDTFIKGCGNSDIIIMCVIYLLAGAFSAVSSAMGGVDSTVNLGLTLIPAQYVTAGLFVISAFISVATGSSVGTIVAVAPIAVGLADKAGLNLALIIAAAVSGAMCGDNLSIISDTTIAATRTQNIEMRDKFRVNLMLALPAALITIVLLVIFGKPVSVPEVGEYSYNIIKILPYLFVLISAIAGMNVFIVLTGGIVFSGIVGLVYGDFTVLTFSQEIYAGFEGMLDIFILSLLMGGLAQMVTKAGGIQWILDKIRGMIKGKKSAEIGIAGLVSLSDVATANNTVAIIVAGPIAKEISREYKVDPRRSAALLDSFSCVFQGLIPYGAQLLLAGSFTAGLVSPFQIIPLLWYQQILAVIVILSIFFPIFNGYINKNPWDFENDQPIEKTKEELSKAAEVN
ncbi:MAG: Na+/H+ antiporter NhaC family protein [Tissierella sp.]|uniref:Na+/H+ antiporter NhaC family protein n=1 Tax=Tissierella sp. TaxID=41274 RepID=UPI003F946AE8